MATKSEKKNAARRRSGHTKDEFFVQQDNGALVVQYKDKIENMYEIEINMEEQTEDGQWLILHGDPVDRRNAKNYITAMCNPSERKQVQFPSASELTDRTTLEYIEKTTNAFIRPLKKVALFQISGTELAVTLALSQIEELAGTGVEGEGDPGEMDNNLEDDVIEISPSTNKGSSRLSDVLERALSSHSDGGCSAADYRNACPSVQRVLVNCLQDEDENDGCDEDSLFGDGTCKTDVTQNTKDGAKTLTKSMYFVNSEPEHSQESDENVSKSWHGDNSKKMAKLKITEESANQLLTKQQEYLKSFGLSVGFEEHKVIAAVKFVDERTRPPDFLDILNSLPDGSDDDGVGAGGVGESDVGQHDVSDDDDVIIESETIEYADDTKPTEVIDNTVKGEKSALPDGYKERLIQDFFAEDENCSVDDLKRRNAERQKLLRQNFVQQQQSQKSQESSQNKAKKKKRKKKKGKAAEKQQDNTGDDQTCVMKVWNTKEDEDSHNANEGQFQTPKRKNHKPTPPPLLQLELQPPGNFRQSSPNRAQHQYGGGNQWTQPKKTKFNPQNDGPQRGNYKKPTQIVTPVNVPRATEHQKQHSDDNSELRYIVIDGSNVAMTHGNGKHFSCKGIKICVEYFRQRGHDKITVFVPQWRQYRPSENNPILDQDILQELKDDGTLVFTPSRKIDQRLVASYDDRFVLELAEAEEGVIVSNDQYRDLMTEKAAWKKIIHERLLMFSFVRDRFMPPNDPLGREGPCLDDFLKLKPQHNGPQNPRVMQGQGYQYKQQQYYKPHTQGHNYVPYNQGQGYGYTQGQGNFQGHGHGPLPTNYVPTQNPGSYAGVAASAHKNPGFHHDGQQANFTNRNLTQTNFDHDDSGYDQSKSPRQYQKGQGLWKSMRQRIPRTEQESEEFFEELKKIFPEADQEEKIKIVLANHIYEHDFAKLTNDCMNVLF